MAGYKLSAANLNRKKQPGKVTDGLGLFFIRNADQSLTAWQRVKDADGKQRDCKVESIRGEIDTDWLQRVRTIGYELKRAGGKADVPVSYTFERAWTEYATKMKTIADSRWNKQTAKNAEALVERYIKPTGLWNMPVSDIKATDIERELEKMQRDMPTLVPRAIGLISKVLKLAVHDGIAIRNEAGILLDKEYSMKKPSADKHFPAVTTFDGLAKILLAIRYSGLHQTTKNALELQARTCQRSGEVAQARWEEFDLQNGVWVIPRHRMKIKDVEFKPYDQTLILPPQVIELVKTFPKKGEWVFVTPHGKVEGLDTRTMAKAYHVIGYGGIHVPHGWRSGVETLAEGAIDEEDERPLFAQPWIDGVLDHSPQGVKRSYSRDKAVAGMARVLRWWNQELDAAMKRVINETHE